MYQIRTLQNCLFGLIGFQQSTQEGYPELDAELIASSSGMTFQDFHPLISLENIAAVVPGFPDLETGSADQKTLFNLFLIDTVRASTQKLVNAVFQKKKLEQNIKSILEDVQLYHGAGNYSNKIIKQNRFVGFEINLKNATDLAVIISEIGTQFDTKNPEFKLYLFDSIKSDPVKVFTLDLANEVLFGWSKLDKVSMQDGPYYLGYYESDLLGQALRRTEDLTRMPCQGCNNDNITAYNKWSQHAAFRPFYVSGGNYDYGKMWEPGLLTYVNDTNWGLNLKLSVQCDLSNFLCRHASVFTNALGLQVAVDLIEKMVFSCRDNDLKAKLQALGAGALDNSQAGMPGLKKELSKAIDALDFDLSDFDSRCLPCQTMPKISYGAW